MVTAVKIGGVIFKNPIWAASGTFGSGKEFEEFIDLRKVGAIIAKTVTLNAREGNPPPRVVETASGLLNSIGLENKGLDHFIEEILPEAKKSGTRIIASIAGVSAREYEKCAEKLSFKKGPDAIEVNLSCPNVSHGRSRYALISQDKNETRKAIRAVRKNTKMPVIAKLTPNTPDIAGIAEAARQAGADAVSLVNTYPGMAVDADTMKPLLGNITGGLSGPAIKPLALKAVWDVYKKTNIPIIGIGGIMTGRDAAEFMLVGASAVQIGTANLVSPDAHQRILREFLEYLEEKGIKKAGDLVGRMKR
jgi:dihydroorotate dehydrogenase (NAD+) catalytic subunit